MTTQVGGSVSQTLEASLLGFGDKTFYQRSLGKLADVSSFVQGAATALQINPEQIELLSTSNGSFLGRAEVYKNLTNTCKRAIDNTDDIFLRAQVQPALLTGASGYVTVGSFGQSEGTFFGFEFASGAINAIYKVFGSPSIVRTAIGSYENNFRYDLEVRRNPLDKTVWRINATDIISVNSNTIPLETQNRAYTFGCYTPPAPLLSSRFNVGEIIFLAK